RRRTLLGDPRRDEDDVPHRSHRLGQDAGLHRPRDRLHRHRLRLLGPARSCRTGLPCRHVCRGADAERFGEPRLDAQRGHRALAAARGNADVRMAPVQPERPHLQRDSRRDCGDLRRRRRRRRPRRRGGRQRDGRQGDAGRLQQRVAARVLNRALSKEGALAAGCAVLFLTFLDNTILGVALADMQTSLRAGVPALQWIVDGYMLAFTALMLTGGTLGDLLGRKKVMLGGVALFAGGSLFGALSASSSSLIAARVVMGVGAAACEPGTLSLIRHIYPDRAERAHALGIWTAVSGVSLALGPVLGGVLVAAGGWENIFWFNVAFGLVVLAAAWWFVPESSDPQGRHLDVFGLVFGAVAVVAVTFAVIEGENVGCGHWWIPALFVVAALAAIAFVLVERRVRDPVLRLDFFRIPTFAGANVVGFASSFGLFAVFFFSALYLQVVANFSGWRIALEFVAMTVAMVVAGRVAGRWVAARGPRGPMTWGCVLAGGAIF